MIGGRTEAVKPAPTVFVSRRGEGTAGQLFGI